MAREQIPNFIARKSKWTIVFRSGWWIFWPMFLVWVVLSLLHLNSFMHPFKVLGMGCTPYKVSAVDSTCTEEGNIEYYICWKCDKIYSDSKLTKEISKEDTVVAVKDHKLAYNEATESTYEEDGCVEHWACTTCSATFADKDAKTKLDDVVVLKKSHADDEGHVHNLKKKTSTFENACGGSQRVTYYACTDCEMMFQDNKGMNEFDGFAHTPVLVAGKASTCTEKGTLEHYQCSGCKKLYADKTCTVELSKNDIQLGLGHDMYHGVAVKEMLDGRKDIYFCLECDKMDRMYATSDGAEKIARPDTMTLLGMRMHKVTPILAVYTLICLITLICAMVVTRCQYTEFYDSYAIQKRGVFYRKSRKTIFPQASRISVRKHLFNYGDIYIDVVGPKVWDLDLTGYARPEDIREYLVDHMISPSSVDGLSSNPYIAALGVVPDTIF